MNYNNYMAETLSFVAKEVDEALSECEAYRDYEQANGDIMTDEEIHQADLEYDCLKDRVAELQEMVDNHECSLSKNGDCPCVLWRDEIRKIKGEDNSVIH